MARALTRSHSSASVTLYIQLYHPRHHTPSRTSQLHYLPSLITHPRFYRAAPPRFARSAHFPCYHSPLACSFNSSAPALLARRVSRRFPRSRAWGFSWIDQFVAARNSAMHLLSRLHQPHPGQRPVGIMATATAKAVDLVTREGYWSFLRVSPEVVLVEHWPAKPCKRSGFARGSSLSCAAARTLFKKLQAEAV